MVNGDIYQVRFAVVHNDQTAINVLHFRVNNLLLAGPTDQQVADFWDTTLGPSYKALLSTLSTYRGAGARRRHPAPLGLEAVSIAQQGPGTVVADTLPKQVTGLLRLRAAFAGRRFMGRLYFPFPTENINDGSGRPAIGYRAALEAIGTTIISNPTIGAAGNTAQFQAVIFHRTLLTADTIVSRSAPTEFATQRRRGGFGRPNTPPF